MGGSTAPLSGPDFTRGFRFRDLKDGSMLLGHAHGEAVLLVRRGEKLFAVSAFCTHYGGPLAEGIVEGESVRCPWHHACFELSSGKPLSPPALNPLTTWNVELKGELCFVMGKKEPEAEPARASGKEAFVIIGAGAAGLVAAETLRGEGFDGRIVLVGEDKDPPYDRPNLSKDYLAGNAPEEWIPLRGPEHYAERKIELRAGVAVEAIDPGARRVVLSSGESIHFDRLLLATGARPVRLGIPGADLPHVHVLRTLADSRALIDKAKSAKRAVVIGASFIGLEVAASLRARGVEVAVVGKEAVPFERTLGPELGAFVRSLHEEKGVKFHLGRAPAAISRGEVALDDGTKLAADLVVMGVGVAPATELAEKAGIPADRGILVNEYLETGSPGIFAAGDVARFPERSSGEKARIEHWVLAQRQARVAALNMMGKKIRFHAVPFFWSNHYDLAIAFTGYAPPGAARTLEGSPKDRNCRVIYRDAKGKFLAIATIGQDQLALSVEAALERGDFEGIEELLSKAG